MKSSSGGHGGVKHVQDLEANASSCDHARGSGEADQDLIKIQQGRASDSWLIIGASGDSDC